MTELQALENKMMNRGEDVVQQSLYDEYDSAGSGCFSIALYSGDYVIKLGGYNSNDSGGEMWAEFCIDNQDLEAVPKIYASRFLSAGKYILLMERLDNCGGDTDFYSYAQYIESNSYHVDIPKYIVEFIERFNDIRDIGQLDLHDHNYMKRPGTDYMVIIDPFSQRMGCIYEIGE